MTNAWGMQNGLSVKPSGMSRSALQKAGLHWVANLLAFSHPAIKFIGY
jgi:hypothetical protein